MAHTLMESPSLMVLLVSICLLMQVDTLLMAHVQQTQIALVQGILELTLLILSEIITIVRQEVIIPQLISQFSVTTPCGMGKDAKLVTAAVHRLACRGFTEMSYLKLMNQLRQESVVIKAILMKAF